MSQPNMLFILVDDLGIRREYGVGPGQTVEVKGFALKIPETGL